MHALRAALLASATTLILSTSAPAVELEWSAAFGAPNNAHDQYRDMAIGSDGSIYVTGMDALGSSGDIVTVAFDPDGTVRWSATYDGPASGQDVAEAIAVTADGTVYAVGRAGLLTTTSGSDYVVVAYRGSDGTQLWTRLHDADGSIDDARDVAVDADGSVFITGSSWYSGEQADIETVKYDAAGTLMWTARYTGPGSAPFANDRGIALVVDAAGDVIVTGSSEASINDYITLKYRGSDGGLVWSQRYDGIGLSDIPRAMTVDAAGDVYVTGRSYQTAELYATVCYRGSDGFQRWAAIDDPGIHDRPEAVIVVGDAVFVTGVSDPDGDESNNNDDAYTARYRRADGVKEWDARHGETGFGDYDSAHAVAHDGHGNLFVAGRTNSFGADSAVLLLRYDDATGAELERDIHNGPFGAVNTALTAAMSPTGSIVLAGITAGPIGDNDYMVLSFRGPAAGDVNEDGSVDLADLLSVLAAWGACAPPPAACPEDVNGDGVVSLSDLLLILANWS